ncbi:MULTISPECIES: hypothetical protein [Rhodopseudomonas]|uniref:Uncharacterized protein n=1 Tax=Rhodopseudomonas palustris TaxID=1076 RepID=A0A0D7EUU0_RHOPL|nr:MULTISPECIES: hypothetical protein [Rhodopseudomonas]KIZ44411.1 hypothetical protein OO17_09920 [Rhodopseudomonas palustris]MDF3813879.1 hypothetical protein [Rhodopseudomonas sp. BAL398]WOK15469.1 hypothetical protein RBJ75_14845 [Rhodopseudomonas sp. BAL398]
MTRRPGLRLESAAMRAERLAEAAAAARDAEVHDVCRRAVRRGLAAYVNGARDCPMKVCRRARACVSDSFACLTRRRRPVLAPIDETIAIDGLYQFITAREQEPT